MPNLISIGRRIFTAGMSTASSGRTPYSMAFVTVPNEDVAKKISQWVLKKNMRCILFQQWFFYSPITHDIKFVKKVCIACFTIINSLCVWNLKLPLFFFMRKVIRTNVHLHTLCLKKEFFLLLSLSTLFVFTTLVCELNLKSFYSGLVNGKLAACVNVIPRLTSV